MPAIEPYYARFAAASARALPNLRAELDVPYGPGERQSPRSLPGRAPGAPLFFFIHGGYWRRLDKSFFSFLAEPVVRAGGAAAIVNYPLATGATIDEIVAAMRAAFEWVTHNAARLNADPATDRRGRPFGRRTPGRNARRLGAAARGGVRAKRAVRSRTRAALARERVGAPRPRVGERNSPVRRLPESPIRLVAAVGERETDEFKRQTQHYVATWRARRYPAEELIAAGQNHFTIVLELADEGSELSRALAELLFD